MTRQEQFVVDDLIHAANGARELERLAETPEKRAQYEKVAKELEFIRHRTQMGFSAGRVETDQTERIGA